MLAIIGLATNAGGFLHYLPATPIQCVDSKSVEIMNEIWKSIGNYSVSSEGHVKSNFRFVDSKNGSKRSVTERIMKQRANRGGYYYLDLSHKTKTVHRLIAMAFIPNPEGKPQINHINGIKTDNRVENLEWCDASHNTKHAYDNGLIVNGNRKLTDAQVCEIRESNEDTRILAERYNISRSGIYRVLSRMYYTTT